MQWKKNKRLEPFWKFNHHIARVKPNYSLGRKKICQDNVTIKI
ncbi:MAG: hypothetical protein ACI9U5_000062 [Colwellia sp.]|jgi:hypothetical protein